LIPEPISGCEEFTASVIASIQTILIYSAADGWIIDAGI
jgi:hypothetical protein